jgi:hypothetical protein
MSDAAIITNAPTATVEHDLEDARIGEKHSHSNALPDGWDRMSGEALYGAIMRRRTEDCVTISTFRAVRFALRNGGLAALNKQAERLRGFSDRQIESLIRNLHKNRNRFKAGGDPKLLHALSELMP